MRHGNPANLQNDPWWFQSQTRSQPPCDVALSTGVTISKRVSISDEKPAPMRRTVMAGPGMISSVSISDEKPAPMRLIKSWPLTVPAGSFNLRREASPHATGQDIACYASPFSFQSQTRSQPPCDIQADLLAAQRFTVSISDEKPAPMRRLRGCRIAPEHGCFNLRREASPHATQSPVWSSSAHYQFQSQTRSQPPCDVFTTDVATAKLIGFNLRREASPHATCQ